MKLQLTQQKLIVATAIFLVASANTSFFAKVLAIYPDIASNLGLIVTLPIILTSILVLLMTFMCYRVTCRPVLGLFIIAAVLSAHFTDKFGTVFDDAMIRNMLETNTTEAGDLVTMDLLLRFVLLGFLPTLIIWRLPLQYSSIRVELYRNLRLMAAAIVTMLVCILAFSSHYASFAREHKTLRYYINPTYPLYSVVKYFTRSTGDSRRALADVGEDALIPKENGYNELIILVVGETARADHFSLNGYARKTNPLLEQESRLFSYANIASCGTSTAISVPCMFSVTGRADFDRDDTKYTENVLDVLKQSGVSVLWRDNNSNSKDIALRVEYQDFKSAPENPICDSECRDEGLLSGLQEYIDEQSGDILIVLHQMGNHGPAYYKRYPDAFEKFKPVCKSAELAECSQAEIINAYDNALLYTDYFLSKVITLLKANTPTHETVMLYVSDHGESLGEHGIYLHGMPYSIAPEEQKHVPVLAWFGESADINMSTIKVRTTMHSSHDAIFHTLLNAFEVQSKVLDKDKILYDTDE